MKRVIIALVLLSLCFVCAAWAEEAEIVSHTAPKLAVFGTPVTVIVQPPEGKGIDECTIFVVGAADQPYGEYWDETEIIEDGVAATFIPRMNSDEGFLPGDYELQALWGFTDGSTAFTTSPIGLLSVTIPDTVDFGKELPFSAELPESGGKYSCGVKYNNSGIYSTSSSVGDNMAEVEGRLSYEYPMDNGMEPGTYDVSFTWTREDGERVTYTKPVLFSGESFSRPSIEIPQETIWTPGETVTLRGTAGSAERIAVRIGVNSTYGFGYGSDSIILPDENGAWSYDFVVSNETRMYCIEAKGYLNDGTYQGGSKQFYAYAYESPASDAASLSEDFSTFQGNRTVHFNGVLNKDLYDVYSYMILDEDGAVFYTNGGDVNSDDGSFSFYYTFKWAGIYKVQVICKNKQNDNQISALRELTLDIPGKHKPIYGTVPLTLELPETWQVDEDTVFEWTPDMAGQSLTIQLGKDYNPGDLFEQTLTGEGTVIIPGYQLQEGEWLLTITSELDYWEDYKAAYPIHVLPAREITEFAAQVPETVEIGMPFHVKFDVPGKEGTITMQFADLGYPLNSSFIASRSAQYASFDVDCEYMISRGGLVPGEYVIDCIWRKTDGTTQTIQKTITFTGDPVQQPTMSLHQWNYVPGDTVALSGNAGSADIIKVYICPRFAGGYSYPSFPVVVEAESDGHWAYEFPVDDAENSYAIFVKGEKNNGAFQGQSKTDYIYIFGEVPQASQVSLTEYDAHDSYLRVDFSVTAPDDAPYTSFHYTVRKENQEIEFENGYQLSDVSYSVSYSFSEPGTYLLSVVCTGEENNKFFCSQESVLRIVFMGRELPAFAFLNAPESVALFGSFSAQASNLEEADEYIFRIESDNGFLAEARGNTPSVSELQWIKYDQPGAYLLSAIALCNGFEIARDSRQITVEAPASVLSLPEGLTAIEEEAFAGNSAAVVIIPDGCVSIGSRAFADCPRLVYVVLPDSMTEIAPDAFQGSDQAIFSRPVD